MIEVSTFFIVGLLIVFILFLIFSEYGIYLFIALIVLSLIGAEFERRLFSTDSRKED